MSHRAVHVGVIVGCGGVIVGCGGVIVEGGGIPCAEAEGPHSNWFAMTASRTLQGAR